MKIEHIGIWVSNLLKMKNFYIKYFDLTCGDLYINERKNFSSYFLSFSSGAGIELIIVTK